MSLKGDPERRNAMKKVKTISILLILSLIMFALASCGGGSAAEEPAEADIETAESCDAADEDAEAEESDSGVISPEFKKTMDDYEAWFDHYCEVMKKYQENPSDLELLTEMSDLIAEETTMLEQLENMDESEMNNAELAYYIEVTARIEKKLLEAADY